jgi:ubiquinone/menaquinone biosynthesis C-methylase UbiE
MSWDPVWEKIFSERSSWGKYPPEELVRFIAQNYYQVQDRRAVKILEIGCGPGGGTSWYIAREGFTFSGIDGSQTAIDRARQRFLNNRLEGEFVCGSINTLPWGDETFDCVVDTACLQHNAEVDAEETIREVYRVMKIGGRHFSLTSKSNCWGDGTGVRVDETSYREVTEGPFSGTGIVRFATRESLLRLYEQFRELNFEYSIRSVGGCRHEIANWIVTCMK